MDTYRIFVSSPGDVMPERERIDLVARRLNEAFADLVRIKTVLWERKIYGSHDGFQAQIPPAEKAASRLRSWNDKSSRRNEDRSWYALSGS